MSERLPRTRSERSAHLASPAGLGLVRVADGFVEEFPDGDRASTEAMASLVRVGNALSLEVGRAIDVTLGIPLAPATTLAVIEGADQPLTPSQVSERLLVAPATLTATLDLLERRGWVRRGPNPADRRSVLVEITPEGEAVTDTILPGIRQIEVRMMSALSAKERNVLLGLLDKVMTQAALVAAEPAITLTGRRKKSRRRR